MNNNKFKKNRVPSSGQPLYFSRKSINQLIEGLQNKQDLSSLAKESLQILEDVNYNINKILSNLHKIGHSLYEQEVANMEDYEEDYDNEYEEINATAS